MEGIFIFRIGRDETKHRPLRVWGDNKFTAGEGSATIYRESSFIHWRRGGSMLLKGSTRAAERVHVETGSVSGPLVVTCFIWFQFRRDSYFYAA